MDSGPPVTGLALPLTNVSVGAVGRRSLVRTNQTEPGPTPTAQAHAQASTTLLRGRTASLAPSSPFAGFPALPSPFQQGPDVEAQPGKSADPRASLLRGQPTRDTSIGSLGDGLAGALPETSTESWPDDGIVCDKPPLRQRLLAAGTEVLTNPLFQLLQLAAILFVLFGPSALVLTSAPDSANLPTDAALILCMALFLTDTVLAVLCHSQVSALLFLSIILVKERSTHLVCGAVYQTTLTVKCRAN